MSDDQPTDSQDNPAHGEPGHKCPADDYDMMTGDLISVPTEQWLSDNALLPYWMGAFPITKYYEVYHGIDQDADTTDVMCDSIGTVEICAMQFRHGQGEQTVILLPKAAAIRFCVETLEMLYKGRVNRG